MIRIDQRAPVTNSGAAGSAKRSGSSSFSLPTQDSTESASTTRSAGVGATGSLDMLLAVQEQGDQQERKRRQARRGNDLLDGLDRLKAALLSGRVLPSELERLRATLTQRREATDDPRLDEVLAHIELRAAVELAKLGR